MQCVIRRGSFTLSSGQQTDIYFDFCSILTQPKLAHDIAFALAKLIPSRDVMISGVPFAAIPIATLVASVTNLPLIMIRKTAKEYGLQQIICGLQDFTDQPPVVLIEDVITTGASVLETARVLQDHGLRVAGVIAILDREAGGVQAIENAGFSVKCLYTATSLLFECEHPEPLRLRPAIRNGVTLALTNIMRKKWSNLIVAMDLVDPAHILFLIHIIARYVCAIKLHIDLIDFTTMPRGVFMERLKELKSAQSFLVIEDRKYADIAHVTCMQLERCELDVIDIVTVHCIAGAETIREINKVGVGMLLIHSMSSAGNLISRTYSNEVRDIAAECENVVGFVAQEKVLPDYLTFTPGIRLRAERGPVNRVEDARLGLEAECSEDGQGQRYRRPNSDASDLFIVGRGICEAKDPETEAKKYQEACYEP